MIANNIITLTTDFGITDIYVGQMKGAILKQNGDARLIDLTHAVPPQNIQKAASIIFSSYQYFPKGTTHLIVIDPGVGANRSLLAAQADDHFFITPDNGTLSFFIQNNLVQKIYRIENTNFITWKISNTFHGRDILAPIAAIVAAGTPLDIFGPKIDNNNCLSIPADYCPTVTEATIIGHVDHIDHFGNIRTNISISNFKTPINDSILSIELNKHRISMVCSTYAQADSGKLLALIDSAGYLEIAINRGNAAEFTQCRINDPIIVYLS